MELLVLGARNDNASRDVSCMKSGRRRLLLIIKSEKLCRLPQIHPFLLYVVPFSRYQPPNFLIEYCLTIHLLQLPTNCIKKLSLAMNRSPKYKTLSLQFPPFRPISSNIFPKVHQENTNVESPAASSPSTQSHPPTSISVSQQDNTS